MMASNPLFTGPKTGNHHRPGMFMYNTQQRPPLMRTNMGSSTTTGNQDSVETPRKKARLENAAAPSGFDDTFADDDEFLTADALDQIDFMASQAYSQSDSSVSAPQSRKQQRRNKPNDCSVGQATTSSARTFVQSNVPNFDSVTTGSSHVSFGGRQQQNMDSRRQTHASTCGVSSGGSFTFKSASGRTTHVSTNSGLPKSGGSSTKLMDQNSWNLDSKRNGDTAFRQKGDVQVSAVSGTEGNKAGPSSTRQVGLGPDIHQQELDRLKAECDNYKQQVTSLQEEQFGKEGEIKILRDSLKKQQEEIDQFKKARLEEEERKVQAQTFREKEMEKELDRLKTQLQFKEAEVMEAQNAMKAVEQKFKRQLEGGISATTPVNSPKAAGIPTKFKSEQKSPRTPGRGDFPTRESFMEDSKTARSPGQVKGDRSGVRKTPEKLDSPSRKAESPGLKARSLPSPEKASLQVPQTEKPLQLGLGLATDGFSGPLLMQKLLLPGKMPTAYSGKKSVSHNSQEGLLTLFQLHCQVDQHASGSKDHDHVGTTRGSRTAPGPSSVPSTTSSSSTSPNSDHHRLALHGISHLLSPDRGADNLQGVVNKDVQSLSGLLQSTPQTMEATASLLPMIEEYLCIFRDVLQTKINQSLLTCPDSSSKGSFEGGSMDTNNSSSTVWEPVVNFGQARDRAVNALRLLERLFQYCPEVANVLMQCWISCQSQEVSLELHDKTGSTQQEEGDVMIVEEGTSFPRGKKDTPSTALAQNSSSTQSTDSFQPPPWLSTCQLFGELLKLLDLQVNNDQLREPEVTIATLEVLTVLAASCDKIYLDSFKPLFSDNLFPSLLTEDCDVMIVQLCVQLLIALTPCPSLVSSFCTRNESCLLLMMYYHCVTQGGAATKQWVAMQEQVVILQSTLVSTYPRGTSLLVQSDCQCSVQVVRSLLMILYRAVLEVLQSRDMLAVRRHLQLLRRGTLVLHHLSLHDPLFGEHRACVEHQYTTLVHGLRAVLSKLTDVRENEDTAVHDLLELDHLDDSGGSQTTGAEVHMEVDP